MKLIAVSQRIDFIDKREEFRDAIDERLNEFIVSFGGLPVPIPNNLFVKNINKTPSFYIDEWLNQIKPKGFVLSGGNDIGEYLNRDNTENKILNFARKMSLPTLGICRGMQLMTIWNGGKIKKLSGHVNTMHKITGEINENVNSFHNYSPDKCPSDFYVTARSNDEKIEAMSHKNLPWEGWMWHPEREKKFQKWNIIRAKNLFN